MGSTTNAPILSRRAAMALGLGGLSLATMARAAPPSTPAPFEILARQAIAEDVWPGVSISVMKSGQPIYAKGFGMANLETATPVTPKTAFKIGSITKQFTAAALVQLEEEGKLSFDDPLARYLPEYPRASEVTLRQMLHHTSGIGNYTDRKMEDFFQSARLDYDSTALLKAMIEQTQPPYSFEPGASWGYSNTAFVLLGLVIERICKEPYGAVFKRRLFDPAMMRDTAVDDASLVVPGRASGYTHAQTPANPVRNASYISMTFPGAAGSIRSTADDLCRWHAALFTGRIVKPSGLAEMIKPGTLKDGSIPTNPKGGPEAGSPLKYGFGLSIGSFEGRPMIGHNGGINGFVSVLQTFPEQRSTFAVLINADGMGKSDFGPKIHALQDAVAHFAVNA